MTAVAGEAARPVRSARSGRWGLWSERTFRRLWIGETTSGLGTAVGEVALVLVAVTVLHASPLMVGVLTASAWLPWLFLGISAGAWVDRWPRRTVMLVGDLASLLLFGSVPVAAWCGVLTIWQLLAVAFLAGAAKVFFVTAYRAIMPSLVAESDLMEANTKLQSGAQAMDIAGPGVAGVVAQLLGAVIGVFVDACSYVVSALCLSGIKVTEQRPAVAERRGIRREIAEGVRFVVGDPYLRAIASFAGLANLGLSGIQAVQTVFLVRSVGLGPSGVGAVFAVASLGGLIGATLAGRIAKRFGSARGMLLCALLGAPFMLLVPLAGRWLPVPVSALAWGLAVGGVIACNVIVMGFYQAYCPTELLGRIIACVLTVGYSAMPVGALLGGFLGDAVGSRTAFWIMTVALLAGGWTLLLSPIRGLREFPGRPEADRRIDPVPTGQAYADPA